MIHLIHFIKSLLMTAAITLLPVLIFTGGSLPPIVMHSPIYQFFVVVVFGYAMAPVIADFAGNHIGQSLFHPNRANVAKPTLSHIITLRNKCLYREATEELRMLNELFPEDIEPYKMLLHLSAHELPDRSLFDLTYRKGKRNLIDDDQRAILKRYRDEHIQNKESSEEEWAETSHSTKEKHHSKEFSANRDHHRETQKHKPLESKHEVIIADQQPRERTMIHQKADGESLQIGDERFDDQPSDEKNFGTSRTKLQRSGRRTKSYRFVRSQKNSGPSIHASKR